jgi:DNA repair protein RadC
VIHLKEKIPIPIQQNLFTTPAENPYRSMFISTYRVTLIKDRQLPFESCRLNNSAQAQPLIKSLIETHGQSDREQFCVLMLNAKNEIIGLNIVSTSDVSSATVTPRELLKPAILSNSSALILAHNHPSGDVSPSQDDIAVTQRIVHASKIMGIVIHEHLIISMFDDRYYSFADNGIIKRISDEIN